MSDSSEMDWETWHPTDPTAMAGVLAQLKVEVGPRHQIYHFLNDTRVFAKDGASDDILISNPKDNQVVFLVHPTGSKTVEIDERLPWTMEIEIASVPIALLKNYGL